jgi:hypothetical protein
MEARRGKGIDDVAFDFGRSHKVRDNSGKTKHAGWRKQVLLERSASRRLSRLPSLRWHFNYSDWQKYPILNITFEKLGLPTLVSWKALPLQTADNEV